MEEAKYYTPDLYEFRLGLKYEIVEEDFPVQKEYHYTTPLTYVMELLETKQVRVKVLDTDDVEHFGFRRVGNPQYDQTGEYTYVLNDYSLVLRYGSVYAYVVIRSMDEPLLSPGFSGMCRNRLELADIIRMLGITNRVTFSDEST